MATNRENSLAYWKKLSAIREALESRSDLKDELARDPAAFFKKQDLDLDIVVDEDGQTQKLSELMAALDTDTRQAVSQTLLTLDFGKAGYKPITDTFAYVRTLVAVDAIVNVRGPLPINTPSRIGVKAESSAVARTATPVITKAKTVSAATARAATPVITPAKAESISVVKTATPVITRAKGVSISTTRVTGILPKPSVKVLPAKVPTFGPRCEPRGVDLAGTRYETVVLVDDRLKDRLSKDLQESLHLTGSRQTALLKQAARRPDRVLKVQKLDDDTEVRQVQYTYQGQTIELKLEIKDNEMKITDTKLT